MTTDDYARELKKLLFTGTHRKSDHRTPKEWAAEALQLESKLIADPNFDEALAILRKNGIDLPTSIERIQKMRIQQN